MLQGKTLADKLYLLCKIQTYLQGKGTAIIHLPRKDCKMILQYFNIPKIKYFYGKFKIDFYLSTVHV